MKVNGNGLSLYACKCLAGIPESEGPRCWLIGSLWLDDIYVGTYSCFNQYINRNDSEFHARDDDGLKFNI